jgi:hypothetical protein
MTHLLIPIKDIEAEIKHNREYLNSLQRNKRSNDSDKLEQKTEFLEDLLTGKQISLNEKDITRISLKIYPEKEEIDYDTGIIFDGNRDYRIGYKQALKDLL